MIKGALEKKNEVLKYSVIFYGSKGQQNVVSYDHKA